MVGGNVGSPLSLQFALSYAEGRTIRLTYRACRRADSLPLSMPHLKSSHGPRISKPTSSSGFLWRRQQANVSDQSSETGLVKISAKYFLRVCRLCRRPVRRRCRVRWANGGLGGHSLEWSMGSRILPRRWKHDHLRADFHPFIKVRDILVG